MQNKLFITHIPYRGTGPALQDVVADQVDMMFDTLAGAAPFIKNGQLIAVAVASNQRSPAFQMFPLLKNWARKTLSFQAGTRCGLSKALQKRLSIR